jgi:hypothetical protein
MRALIVKCTWSPPTLHAQVLENECALKLVHFLLAAQLQGTLPQSRWNWLVSARTHVQCMAWRLLGYGARRHPWVWFIGEYG